jgi:hypothetical protein
MTEPSQPDSDWLLAGQIPQPEGAPALEVGRALTPDELAGLDEASDLLNRLSANNAYARAVDLLLAAEQQHEALLGRDRPPPPAALGPLAAAIAAACVALAEVPSSIIADVESDLDAEQAAELRQAVEDLADADVWRAVAALPAVTADRRAHLTVRDKALHLTEAGRAAIRSQAEVTPAGEPVLAQLHAAAALAQEMTAERLVACEDLIDRHAVVVRRLAAEVPLGAPVALRWMPGEDEASRKVEFKPLPLDRIEYLYVAVRRAGQLLDERSDDDADEDDAGNGEDAGGEGDATLAERAEDATDDAGEPEDEDDEDEENEEKAIGGAGPPPAEALPLDFSSLVAHAERLPTELERAWSEALDQIGLDEAHEELRTRWQAVFTATVRFAQASQARAEAEGLDCGMPFHPSDAATLGVLDVDGDVEAQRLGALLGQMSGVQALAESVGRLSRKDQGTGMIRSPEDPSWWEAGAFAETRGRAFALRRLTTEVEAAERARLAQEGDEPVPTPARWGDRLRLAEEARDRGDFEAAVVHAWLAVRERGAQLAGVRLSEVTDSFEDRLAQDPELSEIAPGFPLLRDLSRRALGGDPAPLGFYAHTAFMLVEPLRRICSGLSQALPRAVHEPDS